MIKIHVLIAAFGLIAAPLLAQDQDPAGPVRVTGQPHFKGADGSVSEIHRGRRSQPNGAVRLLPTDGGFTLTFVMDDAGGCIRVHSVEHRIKGDTITVTLFDNAPALCPQTFTPTAYTLRLEGVKRGRYLLRVYQEGRGGRGGEASGTLPWLSVRLVPI